MLYFPKRLDLRSAHRCNFPKRLDLRSAHRLRLANIGLRPTKDGESAPPADGRLRPAADHEGVTA
jgi:hypothetical protein